MGPARTREPAGSSAMVERVVRHIDKLIGTGALKPGDAIREPALIASLGIGRVPVREAIRILAGEGLLELVPNRSARVRLVDETEIWEMLDVLTGFSVTAIHLLSAAPLPPALAGDLTAVAERIGHCAKHGGDSAGLMREISRFHDRLIQASGNRYLIRLVRKTRIHYYSRSLIALLGPRALAEAAPRYAGIAAALARGDFEAAIRILRRSVTRAKSHARTD